MTLFHQILVSPNPKPIESFNTDMHLNGLNATSVCIYKIMEHADDIGQLVG